MPRQKKPRPPCKNCGQEVARPIYTYCNNSCQQEFQYKAYIVRWKAGLEDGNMKSQLVSNHVRRYLFHKHDSSCEECGWNKTNPTTGKVPLTVEHINGDWSDSRETNLKLLCPNCHSLTATYGALNKGSGRTLRQAKRS